MYNEDLKKYIINGDSVKVKELVTDSLKNNISPKDILYNGLIAGMDMIGQRFKSNEIFIPEVLIAAEAMNEALILIEPHLAKAGVKPRGKVIIGTVKGDLHDIGKNLVSMMLKGAGFSVVDCGIDVQVGKFMEAVEREDAQVLAMSCLITTSMPSMAQTMEELKNKGLREEIRVMVGGAPVTRGFADKIGADGYGANAAEAVALAKRFLEGARDGSIQEEAGLHKG